jgi:hypothetical protein
MERREEMPQSANDKDEKVWKPPARCSACVWGRWEGSVHFCMLPVCIKSSAEQTLLHTTRG